MLLVSKGKRLTARDGETTDATAEMLCRLVPTCSVCSHAIAGHRYAKIGSAFQKPNMIEMFRIIEHREWSKVRDIHEFDPVKNVILAFAVAGSHEGRILLAVKNPFELYDADELYMAEVLSAQEMGELTAQVSGDAWRSL